MPLSIKHTLQDTAWMIVLQGLNYLVPLFVWPYLMVILGAEGFGIVGFALQLMQFMMIVVDFGFNLSATKKIATAPDQETIDKVATETLYSKLCLLAVCAALTFVILLIPHYAPYRLAVLVMFPMLIGNIFSFQWLYQGFGRIKQVSMVNCICRLLILPLTFWLVKQPDDVLLAVGIQSSTFVLSGIVMTIWTVRERLFSLVPMYWRAIHMALKDSLPLFLSTATSSVYAVLFVVILGYFTTPYEVGCYAAVEKIMRVMCYLFLLPAIQVFYPHVSKLFTENRQAAQQLVRRILCVLIAVMALMGIALFFGGETAIRLLGKDYSGTESLFRIMAFVPLFVALSGVCGQLGLVACGEAKQYRQFRNVYFAGAGAALLSVAVLSPVLNAHWAAGCLLLAEGIVGIGMYVCYKRI